MSNSWAIEAHDKNGGKFFFRPVVTDEQIGHLVTEIMTYERVGGIVIYRSTIAAGNYEHVHSNGPDARDCNTCETDEEVADFETNKANLENFGKVAEGNDKGWVKVDVKIVDEVDRQYHFDGDMADNILMDRPDETTYYDSMTKVAGGNEDMPFSPPGYCKICGCPPEAMPMVNRGTGWCSEAHRKEQLSKGNE